MESTSPEAHNSWDLEVIREAARAGARQKLGWVPEIEDVAQIVVLEMLQKPPLVGDPRPLAFTRGRLRAIDHLRRTSRETPVDPETRGPLQATEPSPEELVLGMEHMRAIFETAREILTERQFDAFVGYCTLGSSVAGAARVLAKLTGRSPVTVRTHIRRALEKMRDIGGDEDD